MFDRLCPLFVDICPVVIIIATYTCSVHFHQLVMNFHLYDAFRRYTWTTFAARLTFKSDCTLIRHACDGSRGWRYDLQVPDTLWNLQTDAQFHVRRVITLLFKLPYRLVIRRGFNEIFVLLCNIPEDRRYLLDSSRDERREWGFGTTKQKTSYE